MSADDKTTAVAENDDDLVDYEEAPADEGKAVDGKTKDVKKGSYAGIHSSGFRDFLLKPELLHSISDCGFEHPSEVQQECIPQAILGTDVICQAKSGMGKTAVFVLAVLQQIEPKDGEIDTLVLCPTRELAFQIAKEFQRFTKYLAKVKVAVLFGGIPIRDHRRILKEETPHVVVGTPGRIKQLIEEKSLDVTKIKRFVLDEADQMLEAGAKVGKASMRADVQKIYLSTPREKQVMMFSATLSKDIRAIAKKFTQNPMEIFVDDEAKLTLHGLRQYYVKLTEAQKNRKLNDLLDQLDFNQVVIFVNGVRRCRELNKLLNECNFPSICTYGGLKQEERIERYNQFKDYKSRLLVATDLFGRGVDFERVNIVINYDMPENADQYLHRVGRSGRFGTKGLAITFIASETDSKLLEQVQSRFEVEIPEMPDTIDPSTYMH